MLSSRAKTKNQVSDVEMSASRVETKNEASVAFFDRPPSPEVEQIRDLVYYAAPLDQVEALIRKNPTVLLKVFEKNGSQGTLLQLAVIGLDQNIRGTDPNTWQLTEEVSDEGTAERLLSLYYEFEQTKKLPVGSFERAKQLANEASSIVDEKSPNAQGIANINACRQFLIAKELFYTFVDHSQTNEEIMSTAIETFKKFVKNLKMQMTVNGKMTTNRYHRAIINLIHHLFHPSHFGRRGLPDTLRDRFCVEIIGDVLKPALKTAPRVQQILNSYEWMVKPGAPTSFERFSEVTVHYLLNELNELNQPLRFTPPPYLLTSAESEIPKEVKRFR